MTIQSSTSQTESLVYTVTPYISGCPGQSFAYTINVTPITGMTLAKYENKV